MNNSYFVCDVAPMKLRVYCMHLLLQRRKKLHKNFIPLLTHENACIIYTEVTWRLLFTLGCSWVVRHPFRWFTSPLVLYRGFHSGFSMGLCREPVQGGKFQKSKKRGLILSVKLQQNYKEKNMTTTINCYLNTT